MSEEREEGLSALLHETRTFPPPDALVRRANAGPGIYDEANADPPGLLGLAQAEQADLGHALDRRASIGTTPVRQVVRGRES